MTDEMLALAEENQRQGRGHQRRVPQGPHRGHPAARRAVDVVISNCVINLSADKPQVMREAFRVLKPGGRFAVSDVVADAGNGRATRADMAACVGCIAGALTREDFQTAPRRRRPGGRRDRRNPPRPPPRPARPSSAPASRRTALGPSCPPAVVEDAAEPGDTAAGGRPQSSATDRVARSYQALERGRGDERREDRHADDDGEQLGVDDTGGGTDSRDDDADLTARHHADGYERALAPCKPERPDPDGRQLWSRPPEP